MDDPTRHLFGPALVLAGPGSGKTRTVVHRTAYLLEEGIPPGEITLVTFTRKAAGEMRHRLESLVGEEAEGVLATTFHGLSARILEVGQSGLQVLGDPEALMRRVLRELRSSLGERAVLTAISRVRNSLDRENPDLVIALLAKLYPEVKGQMEEAYRRYEETKAELGFLDYDDLLHLSVRTLEEDEETRAFWQMRARFISVDEFQDTNPIQLRLLTLLLTEEQNVYAVGDPNQAIYSWRGADPRIIQEFRSLFPRARVYTLEVNHRSGRGIVEASVEMLRKGGSGQVLPMRATREGPPPVKVVCPDEPTEGLFVAEAVKRVLEEGVPPGEVAVLLRSLAYSRTIEAGFRRYGISYTVVGGTGFWKRKEVQLVLNFLRAPKDPLALSELAQTFLKGVGPKKAEKILKEGPAFLEGIEGGRELLSHVESFRPLYGLKGGRLVLAIEETVLSEPFQEYITPLLLKWSEDDLEEVKDRMETIRQVLSAFREWGRANPEGDLLLLLSDLADPGEGENGDGVQIMTVHASKGLEFTVVFLPSLVEGRFPSRRSTRDPLALEEELRLFYVGLTRAKERVYLSFPKEVGWGRYTPFALTEESTPSRFFVACPGKEIQYDPTLGWHGEETTRTIEELGKLFG